MSTYSQSITFYYANVSDFKNIMMGNVIWKSRRLINGIQ